MKGALLEAGISGIKFPDENTAIVIATGYVKLRLKKKSSGRLSINTTFLVKQQGEWKICSFQNTRIKRFALLMRFLMWVDKKMNK